MTAVRPASPPNTPQSPWAQWFERYYGMALRKSGADPDFVGRLVVGLLYPAELRRCQRMLRYLSHEEINRIAENAKTTFSCIKGLQQLHDNPAFAQLPVWYRYHTALLLREYLSDFDTCVVPFRDAQQHSDADDPLLPLLRQELPAKRGKGRPAHLRSTLFMILLSEHVQARHGRPHYRWVGAVAAAIFPQCFGPDVLKNPLRLARHVEDRCRKFRERHARNLASLREAVLSMTASEMP